MKPVAVPLAAAVFSVFAGISLAKLPPPSDEAKAKAAETAAKTAWSDKVSAFKLCKTMDKVAAQYFSEAKKGGKAAKAPVTTPPCTDPGPFVAQAGAPSKPLEAAGAHSPPQPATSPPSTTTPHAASAPAKK